MNCFTAPLSICVLLLFSGAGCNFDVDKGVADTAPTGTSRAGASISFAQVNDRVFAPRCISCHGNSGGVNLESYQSVKANLSRIERVAIKDRSMPKNRPLADADAQFLSAWIDSGAPEFGVSSDPTPTPTSVPDGLKPNFVSIKKHIFENRCMSCHSSGGPAAMVPLDTLKLILESPRDLVLPGDFEESGLYIALTRNDSKRMPPPSGGSALSENEISVIRDWIEIGAPEKEGDPGSPTTGGSSGDPVDPAQISYSVVRKKIFEPRCISCHGSSGGLNLETYLNTKAAMGQIAVAVLVEKRMPPDGDLKATDLKLLSEWIKAGAPENAIGSQPVEPITPTYSSISRNVFEPKCASCHSDGGSAHSVPLMPWKALLKSPRDLVLPGGPEESGLMIAITRTDSKRMPPASSGGNALSDLEISAIRNWIQNGGKEVEPSPTVTPSPFPSPYASPQPSPSVNPTPSPSGAHPMPSPLGW